MTYEQTNEYLLDILTKNTLAYIFSDDDPKNIMAAKMIRFVRRKPNDKDYQRI